MGVGYDSRMGAQSHGDIELAELRSCPHCLSRETEASEPCICPCKKWVMIHAEGSGFSLPGYRASLSLSFLFCKMGSCFLDSQCSLINARCTPRGLDPGQLSECAPLCCDVWGWFCQMRKFLESQLLKRLGQKGLQVQGQPEPERERERDLV